MPRKITIEIPDPELIPKAVRKLSLAAYLCVLFRQNEKLFLDPNEQPWTDPQLREICRRRFPKSATVAAFYDSKKFKTINQFRSLFNRGTMQTNIDYRYYPFISFRYDEFGERVEGRKGITVLTSQEVTNTIRTLQTLRHERGVYVPEEYLT